MRNRFARACTMLAAGVAITSTIGLSVAGVASASTSKVKPNATPACGSSCSRLSSLTLGLGTIQNAYIAGDTGSGAKVGQKVNLNYASNTHPNEDFQDVQVGTLADFCPQYGGSGLKRTSYVCINYSAGYPVMEANWAPYGNQSGYCTGAYVPVYSGENVTLQNCGSSTSTLWVEDLANAVRRNGHLYYPWVNGNSSGFSHPLTLQVNPGTQRPINQLMLKSLNTLSGGTSPDNQEFTSVVGAVK